MKYVVANHKNYMLEQEVINYVERLNEIKLYNKCNLVICPSSIYLSYYKNQIANLGVQDFDILRPLSGGISVQQISSLGINYCIVGHSDNRIYKNENEEIIRNKVELLLSNNIVPILCFGEITQTSLESTVEILTKQLFDILDFQNLERIDDIIFAYEPIWSINNGKDKTEPPKPYILEKIISEIKHRLKNRYKVDVKILYGGSVNKYNIEDLNSIDIIDGYLIGKTSTNFDDFSELIDKL